MTFSVPSFLAAATRPLIPPNAGEVAFDADAVEVPELERELSDALLPHAARTIRPLTAAAVAIVFPLRTCAPSDLRNHYSPGPGRAALTGGILAGRIGRPVAVVRHIT
jgi:hypothetical protein